MKRYRAYGLTLACERELPLAPARAGAPVDETIAVALGQPSGPPAAELRRELIREGDDWSLRFVDPAGHWLHFDHDEGARTLTVAGSVGWEEAAPVLAGVVCAVLLGSAGRPLLHGAAVAFGGEAIAILGHSGQGKSTLAAGLVARGGRVLTEDLVVLERAGSGFSVEPGHGVLSLLPDAAEALRLDTAPRAGTGKGWIGEPSPAREAAPLRAVYILGPPDPEAPAGRATALSRTAATAALCRHLYGAGWIRPPAAADFAFCVSLAAKVPVLALSRAESLERVEDGAAMLRSALVATRGARIAANGGRADGA